MVPVRMFVIASAVVLAAMASIPAASAAEEPQDAYQIIHATPDRIWRLNRHTGEVAVCTLDTGRLVCIPSVEAPKADPKTLGQIEAEKAQADAAAERQRQEEKAKSLKVLDQMIEAFRQFIQAAMKADQGDEQK